MNMKQIPLNELKKKKEESVAQVKWESSKYNNYRHGKK